MVGRQRLGENREEYSEYGNPQKPGNFITDKVKEILSIVCQKSSHVSKLNSDKHHVLKQGNCQKLNSHYHYSISSVSTLKMRYLETTSFFMLLRQIICSGIRLCHTFNRWESWIAPDDQLTTVNAPKMTVLIERLSSRKFQGDKQNVSKNTAFHGKNGTRMV